jgi:hypothetical protein
VNLRITPRIWPWLQRPHPVPPFEATALISPAQRGPRFGPFIGHSHVRQNQPDPGAPAYAYEGLGLVEFSPIGPSVINRNYLFPLATAQPLFAGLAVPLAGLGGLVQGQMISQPLLYDPGLQSEDLSLNPFAVV